MSRTPLVLGALGALVVSFNCLAGSTCCQANTTAGCDDPGCEATVCAQDAFCCDVQWDLICANLAFDLCPDLCGKQPSPCGDPGAGDCCFGNGTPGCDDAACCDAVCAFDAFCCDVEWDSICAGFVGDLCPNLECGALCDLATDCCSPNDTPGCDDATCEANVCGFNPACCEAAWDELCAEIAAEFCDYLCTGICGCPEQGDCQVANGTPGCDDAACCQAICDFDAFCCDVSWDGICAGYYTAFCSGKVFECGGENTGDCCEAHGTPACSDAECCEAVCAADGFCCQLEWDIACVAATAELCPGLDCGIGCGGSLVGTCCEPTGLPGCAEASCCEAVCAFDLFCCDVQWDQICANYVPETCPNLECDPLPVCGDAAAGDCCAATNSPACSDAECCESVCAADAFCCDVQWDQICADDALEACPDLCGKNPCPADLDGNGAVDGGDLGILLSQWNGSGSADLDGSGTVDGGDLGILLSAWGPCP